AAGNQKTSTAVTVTVSNAPPPDTTPPTVSITSPASGATVSGTTTVSASASDNVGVAGVQFFVDGSAVGSEDTTSPYSVAWNTTAVSNGSHSLTARARDAAGNQKTSTAVTVTVSNAPPPDTTPPTVSITSPASGATVSGTTTVSASASDDVGVSGVQFFVDGSVVGSEDTTSPYSVAWNTTAVSNGSHSLTARARDSAGNQTTSAAVTVTVSNAPPADTTPPTVSITSPASGATVSGTTTVSASASDNVGVAGVQFFVDGSAAGSEDTTSPYSFAWNTTTVANGSHSLTARARDAAGNQTTSATVTVTVSNGTPPSTTRFEESAATLTPSGAWTVTTSAGVGATLSGGQAVYSGASGARATFTFNGTGISWIGLPCEICGFSNVFLDGALVGTVDTYTATRPAASRAMFTRSGLAAGSHTLAIEATGTQNAASGGANVVVDAFDVEGSSGGGGGTGPHRVEENDPSVAYTGTWLTQARGDLSGGTVVEGADVNSTSSLTFNSTGVKWIGFKGPWAGIAEVYLDGTLRATVDTYGPVEQAQVVMYTFSGLPSGTHTIQIKVTGTWSASSSSAWIVVDAFDVE
ncbi:MAG TPA: Ig-like domain-containing protein, partial [Candidatus Binatia bacterium]|nr:Ig-like domain-containing protein [Candidatus Binatia bacterium]